MTTNEKTIHILRVKTELSECEQRAAEAHGSHLAWRELCRQRREVLRKLEGAEVGT